MLISGMNRVANDQSEMQASSSRNESVGVAGRHGEKALQEELARLTREIKEVQERVRMNVLRCQSVLVRFVRGKTEELLHLESHLHSSCNWHI